MALKIHGTDNIQAGTVQTQILAAGVGGGPKITSVVVTDSSYTNIDDTAVGLSGGYIKITGTGFVNGCQVVVGATVATSITFVSSTEVRAQIPAQSAGSYTLYVTNTDGGVAIRVNAVNYSSTPSWTTTNPLSNQMKNTSISLQLVATSNSSVTYALQAGSSLPSSLSLSSSGLITGTTPDVANETTYNFTIVATDQENQDTPQAFQVTITVNDPYYELVTLHLPGTGTNLATNNTFLDGSTNNFTITRNGNTTQGTFSPFSQTGWGNYFYDDRISVPASSAFAYGTGAFTVEFWVYPNSLTSTGSDNPQIVTQTASGQNYFMCGFNTNGSVSFFGNNSAITGTAGDVVANRWQHIAYVRESTSTNGFKIYVDGVVKVTATMSVDFTNTSYNPTIGNYTHGSVGALNGYLSNVRITKGRAVYTGSFTPPTSALTRTTGGTNPPQGTECSWLTCQSNRFLDSNGPNTPASSPLTITVTNDPSVVAFSPFNPTASWSAATHGGSAYFDGTGDTLTVSQSLVNTLTTMTIEGWFYINSSATYQGLWGGGVDLYGINLQYQETANQKLHLFIGSGGAWSAGNVSNTSLVPYTWYHIAYVRSGTTHWLYINGVVDSSINGVTNSVTWSGSTFYIGVPQLTTRYYNGYVANFRISNSRRYNADFTPPTSLLSSDANTVFLLNGSNAGVWDATGKNVLETVGDAKISTAQSKWGGSSMLFDGTGDYLAIPANAFFNQNYSATNKFTIEFWFYQQSLAGAGTAATVISTYGGGGSADGWRIETSANAPANSLRWVSNGSDTACSATVELNTWNHFAFTYNGTTIKVFKNGVLGNTATTSWTNNPGRLFIGTANASLAFPITGYLSDLRITNAERYTANFTPPTAPFPTL